MFLVFDSIFQFFKFVSKNPSHTVETCLPFDILHNISPVISSFLLHFYFAEFFIIPYCFPESVIYFTYLVFFIELCLYLRNNTYISLQVCTPVYKPRYILHTHLLAMTFQLLYISSENWPYFTVNISDANNIFVFTGPHGS